MKSKIFYLLICSQLVIAIFLGIKIYQQRKVLGTQVHVAPIDKESLIFNSDSELEYFYEPKANSIDNVNPWAPYKATYTINSDSLNERFDYAPEKPDKTFRIVTLGDSYTYGLYVDTENNYSEQLENLLNNDLSCNEIRKFEVINLGVQGYDIQYSSERYRLRGQKYDPDLIIWFIKNDDLIQVNEVMLPQEKIIGEELRETGEFDKFIEQGELYPSWVKAMQTTLDQYGRENLIKLQIHLLEDFQKSYPTPLMIATFPYTKYQNGDVLGQFAVSQPNVYFHDEIPEILDIKGATFPNDGHPTTLGHKLIAESILEYLLGKSLIPCD